MYEIGNFIRSQDGLSKRLAGLNASFYILEASSGKWYCAGMKIPVDMAYVDHTPELLERAKFGGRFGPKKRVFATWEEGRDMANKLGFYDRGDGMFV